MILPVLKMLMKVSCHKKQQELLLDQQSYDHKPAELTSTLCHKDRNGPITQTLFIKGNNSPNTPITKNIGHICSVRTLKEAVCLTLSQSFKLRLSKCTYINYQVTNRAKGRWEDRQTDGQTDKDKHTRPYCNTTHQMMGCEKISRLECVKK